MSEPILAAAPAAAPLSPWRLSVAPMLDWTDRHCRHFHRLLTRRTRLYTSSRRVAAAQAKGVTLIKQWHHPGTEFGAVNPQVRAASNDPHGNWDSLNDRQRLEAVFTVLAIRDGVIPPTLNLENPDEAAAGLDLVALEARKADLNYALSNGFGFGGVNACVLFKKWAD